jgi:hypothetical protein
MSRPDLSPPAGDWCFATAGEVEDWKRRQIARGMPVSLANFAAMSVVQLSMAAWRGDPYAQLALSRKALKPVVRERAMREATAWVVADEAVGRAPRDDFVEFLAWRFRRVRVRRQAVEAIRTRIRNPARPQ